MIKNHHEFILHATEVVKGCAVFDVHVCSAGGIVLKSLHSAFCIWNQELALLVRRKMKPATSFAVSVFFC